MPIYNVVTPVIANLDAETPEAATKRLNEALEAVGFTVYDEPEADSAPFEAEPGTETDTLPVPGTCRCQHGDYENA